MGWISVILRVAVWFMVLSFINLAESLAASLTLAKTSGDLSVSAIVKA